MSSWPWMSLHTDSGRFKLTRQTFSRIRLLRITCSGQGEIDWKTMILRPREDQRKRSEGILQARCRPAEDAIDCSWLALVLVVDHLPRRPRRACCLVACCLRGGEEFSPPPSSGLSCLINQGITAVFVVARHTLSCNQTANCLPRFTFTLLLAFLTN